MYFKILSTTIGLDIECLEFYVFWIILYNCSFMVDRGRIKMESWQEDNLGSFCKRIRRKF